MSITLRAMRSIVFGLAATALLLVPLPAQGQPRPSIDPSSGVVVAQLGARPFLHEGRVRSIVFVGDTRRVVSVDDRKVTFWSVPDGKLLYPPARLSAKNAIRTASAAANGRIIAFAAGQDISVVDSQRPGEIRSQGRESAAISRIAVSADGRWVATGADSQVSIRDSATGVVTLRLALAGNGVAAIAFSPDGQRLATSSNRAFRGGRDLAIQLWSLSDGQELRRWVSMAEDLAFSPDGRTLAANTESPLDAACWRAAVRLYDTSTGVERWQVGGTFGPIAFSPDGSRVVSGGLQQATVFDAASGTKIRTLPYGGGLHVSSLAFSPDGRVLATGADDNRISLWRTADWTRLDSGEGHDGPVKVVAFSPNGRLVASGGVDGTVRLWSWPRGRLVRTFRGVGTSWGIAALQFSDDSERLAAAASGPVAVAVWDVQRGARIAQLPSWHPIASASPFAFLDRNHILVPKHDGSIVEWDLRTKQTRVVGTPTGYVRTLTLAAHGQQLAYVGGTDPIFASEVGLMDVATGKTRVFAQMSGDGSGYPLLADPLGSWVAIAGHAWEPASGHQLPFGRHLPTALRPATASPDGRLIYGSLGGSVEVWEPLTAKRIHTVVPRTMEVQGLAVSPDGRILAGACHDGSIIMIDVSAATVAALPAAPQTRTDFESLWSVLGGEDDWAAQVAVWSLAKAGARAVTFLSDKLAPAVPLNDGRLAELRIALTDVDGVIRMTAARTLIDHGLALQRAELSVLRAAEEESRSSMVRPVLGGLSPSMFSQRRVSTVHVDDLDRSPLPERLRSARAIAALGLSIAPRNARRLLESLAAGHAADPQTIDAATILRSHSER